MRLAQRDTREYEHLKSAVCKDLENPALDKLVHTSEKQS